MTIVKATPEQGFLDNITKNIEKVLECLESDLRYLESVSKSEHLLHLIHIKSDIERSSKQLRFAINNLKDVPEMAFIRWNQLYEINPYW